MLTSIDQELYPNDCEVVEVLPHNQRVFLIQKNGSSSLKKDARRFGYNILNESQIKNLDSIDIYIRDPLERYISGIFTFVYLVKRDVGLDLDEKTLLWVASNYPFINRHYLPQFHWILNLARFTNHDCKFIFHKFENISNIVSVDHDAGIPEISNFQKEFILKNIKNIELWTFLDQVLRDCCGRAMTWHELLNWYQKVTPNPLDIISEKYNSLSKTLNVLSQT